VQAEAMPGIPTRETIHLPSSAMLIALPLAG